MKLLLETIWDFICTCFVWFALVLGFFIGLFLMGVTFKFISNIFMAGYNL